jgi:hypothetical protein
MIAKNFWRASVAALLTATAACGSSTTGTGSQPGTSALIYPGGIVPFKSAGLGVRAGLYPGNGQNCCFLAPKANLVLDKPAGKSRAVFTFYVPKVAPYANGETVTITAAGKSAQGSLKNGSARWLTIQLAVPATQTTIPVQITSSKSFVPSKLGGSADTRTLSVVLTKVDYP